MKNEIDVVRITLKKDKSLFSEKQINNPEDVIEILKDELNDWDRECICVINLQTDGKPISINMVSVGDVNTSIANTSNILKSAILSNAAQIMLVHNHPSKNITPSKEDYLVTEKVNYASQLLDIPLLDHVIIGGNETTSIRELHPELFEKNNAVNQFKKWKFEESAVAEERGEYNGESEKSIKEFVHAFVEAEFDELNTYDSEMNLKVEKIEIYGSRSKGYHTKESDLDVLVQYSGNMKEDALFNILHESKISLSGMTLDINPIRNIESGPIDLYHQRADNILDARMKNKKRLFVDIDGTLAHFEKVDTLERLYEKGYFENLAPQKGVIEAVKLIKETEPDVEVFILSSVLKDSKYALEEKNAWLDKYLPQIDRSHRLFPFCGESKADALEAVGGIRKHDFLLDDYTLNLNDWPVKENAILLLNGINHTHKSWQGSKIRFDKAPYLIASNILGIIKNKLVIQDERPQDIVAYSKQIKEMKENIEINPKL